MFQPIKRNQYGEAHMHIGVITVLLTVALGILKIFGGLG